MRGSVFDMMTIAIFLLGFSLAAVIGYYIQTQWLVQYNALGIQTTVGNATNSAVTGAYGVMDNMFIFVAVLLCLTTLGLAFMVDSHPIFFIFSLIFLIVFTALTAVFSNIYYEIASATGVGASFPGFQLLWQNFPFISILMSLLIVLVMHGKPTSVSGGSGEFH